MCRMGIYWITFTKPKRLMQRSRTFVLLIIGALGVVFFSCSSNRGLEKSLSEEVKSEAKSQLDTGGLRSSIEQSRRAIEQQTKLSVQYGIDTIFGGTEAVGELMDLARQHYQEALALQKSGNQDSSETEFENAIEVLNDLSYYPAIEEDTDFVSLSQRIIKDYEKYISSVQNLGPSTSVFALQEKLSQIVDSINVSGQSFPKPTVAKTTIPLVMNRYVKQNIEFFTTRGRWHMQKWIYRSGLYLPQMKKIFEKEGMPPELAYLSMPESGLNPEARSWARAVGLWQFIRSTGALYGLRANWWYDERRNPTLATVAAAKHLRDLYNIYHNWYLAIAAYNCGTWSVNRAIRWSGGDTDFWRIKRYLPWETRNYVPQYIAVTMIAMNPKEYGFADSVDAPPPPCDTVWIPESIDLRSLANAAGVSVETLMSLNPELVHAATPPDFPGKGYPLLVPDGMGPVFASDYQKLPKSAKLSLAFHRVRWGESLYSIAMMYHVSLASLRRANHIPQYDRLIRPGMVLIIPVSSSYYAGRRGYGLDEVASGNGTHRHSSGSIHIVRRGENLGLIAEEYGTTVRNLERLNNLRGSWIRAGMRLIVSGRASIAAKKLSANLQSPTSSNSAFHRVRWGETLIGIAGRYNVTVSDLRNWNNLPSSRINVGERLRVAPDVAAVNVSQKDIDPPDQTPDADSRMIYRVRQGDSLGSRAQKFGVSLDQLREWNNTARRDIHPGQRIVIYN